MSARHRAQSLARRLGWSLTLVGLLGAGLLLLFIGIEYRIAFRHLSDAAALAQVLHELAEHVLLPMALLIAPMALAGLWAIRRSMRALTDAARTIDAARGGERGFRIDAAGLPRETLPFVDAVNNLLGRIDVAAAAHEGFAADVAHELRTPLALLSLELAQLDHPDAKRLQADVAAMRRLIDQLMLLAQIDADASAHVPTQHVDLHAVAVDVVAQMAPAAIAAGKRLEVEGDRAGWVIGRREAIAAALRNLIDNALRVTPDGAATVVVADRPGVLCVRDCGCGLTEAALRRLVTRHERADHASKHGAGLGLEIVARIMALHGGELATDTPARELCLRFVAVMPPSSVIRQADVRPAR